MSGGMTDRITTDLIPVGSRLLAKRFDASGHWDNGAAELAVAGTGTAIGIDAPSDWNHSVIDGFGKADHSANPDIAMGASPSSGVVGIVVDTACDITLFVWCGVLKLWVEGGAGTANSVKTFRAKSADGFKLEPGTLFYLKASAPVVNAAIGGIKLARPGDKGLYDAVA